MFANLTTKLNNIFKKLTNKGLLTEEDIDVAMREVRLSLLEADVALPVVSQFIENVKDKAVGAAVLKSIQPGQMVVNIVHKELIKVLGGDISSEDLTKKALGSFSVSDLRAKLKGHKSSPKKVDLASVARTETEKLKNQGYADRAKLNITGSNTTIMLVGLQGSGKTTTTGKIAAMLKSKYNKEPLLASTDVYRPAAQLQLATLGEQINVSVLPIIANETPLAIAKRAIKNAKEEKKDIILIDTAGRTTINEQMMEELRQLKELLKPNEILLVTDAMLGQEAARIAQDFNDQLGLTGVILTKMDGDARGGAALSMAMTTNKPVKFMGVGEKITDLEPFHPERIASLILGMGDVVSLVEKAVEKTNPTDVGNLLGRIQKGQFDLNDMLKQINSMENMGSFGSLMKMIPGVLGKIGNLGGKLKGLSPNMDSNAIKAHENTLKKNKAIILSMSMKERKNPLIINANRKEKIAYGSGTTKDDVNNLIKQFQGMKNNLKGLMKMFGGGF